MFVWKPHPIVHVRREHGRSGNVATSQEVHVEMVLACLHTEAKAA